MVDRTCGWVRCFLLFSVAPTPTRFPHPLLETAKELSPPHSAITSIMVLGKLSNRLSLSDVTGSHEPWSAPQVKLSHILFGNTNHFSWIPTQTWFLLSSHLLLYWVSLKSLHFSMTFPLPVPKEHMGEVGIYVRKIQSST